MLYVHIRVSTPVPYVRLILLDRPNELNALNDLILSEINSEFRRCDSDDEIRAIVLAGSTPRLFAAGADIKAMAERRENTGQTERSLQIWRELSKVKTPTIAAVCGLALGGGCELAMICDIMYAEKSTRFGQPEIKLGIIPGGGGTQRLAKCIGKSRAMELILTGDMMPALEALARGLCLKLFDSYEETIRGAVETAAGIARKLDVAAVTAKYAIDESFELSLLKGLEIEGWCMKAVLAESSRDEDDEDEDGPRSKL